MKYFQNVKVVFIITLSIGITTFLFTLIHFNQKQQTTTQHAQGNGIDTQNSAWTDPATLRSANVLPQPSPILEITLHVTKAIPTTPFTITSITKTTGFVPKTNAGINGYLMTIEDTSGNVLIKQTFVIPQNIGGLTTDKSPDFPVIIPWDQTAATVKIYDKSNTLLLEKPLSSLSQNHTSLVTPPVHSIVGSMLTNITTTGEKTHTPLYNTLHAAQSSSGHINIVFLNQMYNGDLTLYHSDTQSIIQEFLGYEPYHARASQILFHVMDTTQNFNCTPTPSPEGTYYLCDNNAIIQAVNAAGIPYDAIAVILNNSSEKITGVASFDQHIGVMVNYHNNTFFATPQDTLAHLGELFAHEIGGHAFAGLADTYVYRDWNGNDYNSSSGIQGTSPRPGCSTNANPVAWQGIINSYDINDGCTYSDWYRSSNTNIMNGNSQYYDSVQQQAINQKMDQIAGPFSDTTPPTCAINSPENNFQFSEQDVGYWDNIVATANDNSGVVRMDLYVDDKPVYTFYYNQLEVKADGSNYWFDFPPDTPIGTHKVYVKAYDENNNICISQPFTYSVVSGPAQNNSPTPSQTQMIPTPTPTSPSGGLTITPTTSGQSQGTPFTVTICPHGIGNCGDNKNPTGQGTLSPHHTSRSVTIALYDSNNNRVSLGTGNITYNSTSENFHGTINVRSLPSGQYIAIVTMQGYLSKTVPGILTVTQGQAITIPTLSVTAGVINDSNQLDILNYNLLISCFGSKVSSASCTTPPNTNYFGSDIDDDGAVGSSDYNLFLRELATQKGA